MALFAWIAGTGIAITRMLTHNMEILKTETLKTAALVALAVMVSMLWLDSRTLRDDLREREVAYQVFLAKKSKGMALYEYISQDSLALFPMDDGRAVICGVLPFKPAHETPTYRE
jgi:4-amino-4-deoxy-L-arabinose transferase-like glycosyltransferase